MLFSGHGMAITHEHTAAVLTRVRSKEFRTPAQRGVSFLMPLSGRAVEVAVAGKCTFL